jgi:cytochrome P450
VRKVLVEQHANFPKHRYMDDLLRPLLGRSIFTSNGEDWAKQRQLMEPAFEQTRMDHAFPLMRDAAFALLERLRAYPADGPCDVEAEMTHFTADVIFRTIFSRPLAADDADRIFRAFAAFQRAGPKATMANYRPRWWQRLVGDRYQRETALAAGEIRELLRKQVAPRHAAFHAGQAGAEVDILGSLLAAREPGSGRALEVEELVNEIAVLYLAGHETSASAQAWALHFLAHDEAIQQRVRAEIDTVLAGASTVELEQLRDLDLVRRVFRETLRLYPPLSFLVREAMGDTCLRDKTVHAGATIVVSPWLIHRHRLYWDRPDEFDPDRFLTEAGRASARTAFLPFSIGPRVCVGAGFALQEAALVLTLVLREFSVAPLPGHEPMPVARLSLRSDRGVKLMLRRR